jgi:hypothetical protein
MSKNRRSSFEWVKSYFLNHFPHVKKVEVEAHQEGPEEYHALLRVKAGHEWFVVKKKGAHLGEALGKAKKGMAEKVRREWGKFKAPRGPRGHSMVFEL